MPPGLRGASPTTMVEAAAALAQQGAYIRALEILAAALKASPRHPEGHALRIDLLRKVGPDQDVAAWLASLNALYERGQADPTMVLELALAEEHMGSIDAALGHYQEVVALGSVGAAPREILEHAQAGVLRCEARLRPGDQAQSAPPAPAEKEPKVGESRVKETRPKEPKKPHGRKRPRDGSRPGTMQLELDTDRPTVDVPVELRVAADDELLRDLAEGRASGFEWYKLAQETWTLGQVGPTGGEVELPADMEGYGAWVREQAARVVGQMHGRAMLAYPDPALSRAVASVAATTLVSRGQVSRVLILCPGPMLPLWQRDLAHLGESVELAHEDSLTIDPGAEEMVEFQPDLVLLDPGEQASTLDSRIGRAILAMAAPHLLMVSLAPVVTDLLSVHTAMSLLMPGVAGSPGDFRRTHMNRSEPWKSKDEAVFEELLSQTALWAPPPGVEAKVAPRNSVALFGGDGPARVEHLPVEGDPGSDRWVRSVVELLTWEQTPGLLLGNDGELVERVLDALEAGGAEGWDLAWDDVAVPHKAYDYLVVVHLDLARHPVLGAMRDLRFRRARRQLLVAPKAGLVQALEAAGLLHLATGGGLDPDVLMRILLRSKGSVNPWDDLSIVPGEVDPVALVEDLEKGRARFARSLGWTRELLWGAGKGER